MRLPPLPRILASEITDEAVYRDRRAARRSFDALLERDFDRVIVSHGEPIESGGRERHEHGGQQIDRFDDDERADTPAVPSRGQV